MDAVAMPQNLVELAALYGRLFQIPPSVILTSEDLTLIDKAIWLVRMGDLESLLEVATELAKRHTSFWKSELNVGTPLATCILSKNTVDEPVKKWVAYKSDIDALSNSGAIVRWLELFLNFYAYEKDGAV